MALLGGGCDLATKHWAEETLQVEGRSISVFEPWLDFSLAYNRGTAFSAVADLGSARWIFGVFALAMVIVLVVMAWYARSRWVEALALGSIAGGALGNGYDRLFRLAPDGGTGVVDFIKVNYPWGGSWPTFNVADALVFVGAAALAIHYLWTQRRPQDPAEA